VDDDEEEELVWEDEHPANPMDSAVVDHNQCSDIDPSQTVKIEQDSGIIDVSTYIGKRVIQLEKENRLLRLREEELSRRLAELETVLLTNGISIASTNQPSEVHSDDSNGSKSRTSEESIVFVDKFDSFSSSSVLGEGAVEVTPLKVDIAMAPEIYRSDSIQALVMTIDTPLAEVFHTPAEARIDDVDADVQYTPTDAEAVDVIKGKNEGNIGHSKVERNLLRSDGGKKSNTDQYLASLDDEDEEDGWN